MSSLFRQWVGGHLISDYASYDPVFLTHAAYLDKLWVDWQKRHPSGLFSFPAEQRFVSLAPFKSSPDDVFSSEVQLCVEYVELTMGVPCELSNGSGYFPITQTLFDSGGYDSEGYDQNGFDSQGYDRLGFGIDGFSRDNFDRFGYDRAGYNIYGFDRMGYNPTGFHLNGTHREYYNESAQGRLYDLAGYNKYGFNMYGYDRAGFDVFGFDAKKYGKNGCNYFSNGPFYILHKAALDLTLGRLSLEEIDKIPSTCTNLAGWHQYPEAPYIKQNPTPGEPWIPQFTDAR